MKEFKLQIESNNYLYPKDIVYAAVSLRGGYVTRDFVVDDTHFESNCAFYNILFNYYRLLDDAYGLHYGVQRAVSTVSFYKEKSEFVPVLLKVLQILFNHDYDEEKFNLAKQAARDNFSLRFKDEEFRSIYKGHEFSDLNKKFTLKQLISDIENINYDDFVKIAKTLLIPSNVNVYINGDTSELDYSLITLQEDDMQLKTVRISGFVFDPYLRQDSHIFNIARRDSNLLIETFDFFNAEVNNFTKLLIVEILAELIPARTIYVWVDSLDASVMFFTDKLQSYKNLLVINDEETYNEARKSLLEKYLALLNSNPEHFAIKASQMMSIGVSINQYLDILNKCSYELFMNLNSEADYKITEAQIVLRKELK